MVSVEGGSMTWFPFLLLAWYVDASWFGVVIGVSQAALVLAVLVCSLSGSLNGATKGFGKCSQRTLFD